MRHHIGPRESTVRWYRRRRVATEVDYLLGVASAKGPARLPCDLVAKRYDVGCLEAGDADVLFAALWTIYLRSVGIS